MKVYTTAGSNTVPGTIQPLASGSTVSLSFPDGLTIGTEIDASGGTTASDGAMSFSARTENSHTTSLASGSSAAPTFSYYKGTTTATTRATTSTYTGTTAVSESIYTGTTGTGGMPILTTTSTTVVQLFTATTSTTITTYSETFDTAVSLIGSIYVLTVQDTVYECESPFEAIWVFTQTNVSVGEFLAMSESATSFSRYVDSPNIPPYSTASVNTAAVPFGSIPSFTPAMFTVGASTSEIRISETTFTVGLDVITVAVQSVDAAADIPLSTSQVTITFSDAVGIQETDTITIGSTSEISVSYRPGEEYQSVLGSVTTFLPTSYARISQNGLTTVMGTDFTQISSVYASTTYTQPTISFFETGLTTMPGGSSSIAWAYGGTNVTGFPRVIPPVSVPGFTDAINSVCPNPYRGVLLPSTNLQISDIKENWSLGGDFSYLWYPWKSFAFLNSREVYLTFADHRTVSVLGTDGSSSLFAYKWFTDTTAGQTYLKVTSGNIVTTTIGTAGATTTTLTNTFAGTATITDSGNRGFPDLFSIGSGNNGGARGNTRVGGYGTPSSSPATLELWRGIYRSTGYSFSLSNGQISVSFGSGEFSVNEYSSFQVPTNVLSVIENQAILYDDGSPGFLAPVFTFNNSFLSTAVNTSYN